MLEGPLAAPSGQQAARSCRRPPGGATRTACRRCGRTRWWPTAAAAAPAAADPAWTTPRPAASTLPRCSIGSKLGRAIRFYSNLMHFQRCWTNCCYSAGCARNRPLMSVCNSAASVAAGLWGGVQLQLLLVWQPAAHPHCRRGVCQVLASVALLSSGCHVPVARAHNVTWCIADADCSSLLMQLGGEWRLRCVSTAVPAVRCPARACTRQLPSTPLTAGKYDTASTETATPHNRKLAAFPPTLLLTADVYIILELQTCSTPVGGGLACSTQPLCPCVAPVGPQRRRLCTGAPAGVAARA